MSAAEPSQSLADLWMEWLVDGKGAAVSTTVSYRAALEDFCRRMHTEEPQRATIRQLDAYAHRLALGGYAKGTIAIRLNALKSYYHFLKTRGHIEADPTADLDVPQPRDFNPIPTFRESEIERLLSVSAEIPQKGRKEPLKFYSRRLQTALLAEPRDTALIALMYACGLRAGEISLLEHHDYDGKYVYIRGAKRATSLQKVGVMPTASTLMAIYLEALRQSPWSSHPALFPPLYEKKLRSHRGLGISVDAVSQILERRIERAEIVQGKRTRLSPHVLRYSIATHFYERGYPQPEIQRHLRHRSLSTTLKYCALGASGLPRLRPLRPHPWMKDRRLAASSE